MPTNEQIQKSDKTAKNAFEATRRIYDLAFIVSKKIEEELAEQLQLKAKTEPSSSDKWFLSRYGSLSDGEGLLLRYICVLLKSSKQRQLPDNILPFVLFSIATRKFEKAPMILYGILKDINWGENKQMEILPFLYELSEKRKECSMEVLSKIYTAQKGTADAVFEQISLFEITDKSFGDIASKIAKYIDNLISK